MKGLRLDYKVLEAVTRLNRQSGIRWRKIQFLKFEKIHTFGLESNFRKILPLEFLIIFVANSLQPTDMDRYPNYKVERLNKKSQ